MTEREAAEALGATQPALRACREAASFEDGTRLLAELKAAAKRAYKRLAFELHPDRTGGDLEAAARLRVVIAAHKAIQRLELKRPQVHAVPIPSPVRVHYSYTATTTSTAYVRVYCRSHSRYTEGR